MGYLRHLWRANAARCVVSLLDLVQRTVPRNVLIKVAVSMRGNRRKCGVERACERVSGHVIKACRGKRGKTPLALNLGTRRQRVVTFTPRSLSPRAVNNPRFPLNMRRGWPQRGPGRFERGKSTLGAQHVAWSLCGRTRLTLPYRGNAADSCRR